MRIELLASYQCLKSRNERFQLVQQTLSPDGPLVPAAASNEKGIAKHAPKALERSAHGWLTQKAPLRRSRDVPLFE
jgi:hypothetical protein